MPQGGWVRRPRPLPSELADVGAFSALRARELGVTPGRLRGGDLETPRRGIRHRVGAPPTVVELIAAMGERMPQHHCLSHASAALLNGVPLPLAIEQDARVHVSVLGEGAMPRGRGVVGHRIDPARAVVIDAGGIRVTDAATTWCQLATVLGLDDLVAAGDVIVTGGAPVGGRRGAASVTALAAAVDRHRGSPGASLLREALPLVRYGPLSRRESLVRLRLVRAGLPEPRLNFRVRECETDGRHTVVDLAYPAYRVAIEYEGDHHRSPAQFRRDLRRIERLHDAGWIVIRATADDVPDDPNAPAAVAFAKRVAARLAARGWSPA